MGWYELVWRPISPIGLMWLMSPIQSKVSGNHRQSVLPDPELLCYLNSVNLVSQVIAKAFCQQVLNIHL